VRTESVRVYHRCLEASVTKNPSRPRRQARITLDGAHSTTEATQVFIANFGQIGSLIKPRREIQPDDGRLDVIIVRAPGPLRGLFAGLEALWQRDLGISAAPVMSFERGPGKCGPARPGRARRMVWPRLMAAMLIEPPPPA